MSWIQLHVDTRSEHVDALSEFLNDLGSVSTTWQDGADHPLYEPPPGETPLWPDTHVVALFDIETDMQHIREQLGRREDFGLNNLRIETLEDKDWLRSWMDDFHPMRFGRRLWIIPSWHSAPDPEATNILLDPGMAFGTGTHATTAMCLRWLDANPPKGKTVIDYGCGSGVLGIAAALLGAVRVIGVDNDPQALTATQENCEKNQVSNMQTCLPDKVPAVCADVLIANILAEPLKQLQPAFSDFTTPGAQLVLSGILAAQAASVMEQYAPTFDMQIYEQTDEWVCLSGTIK